jgi:ribonuclease HI
VSTASEFVCQSCQKPFGLSAAISERYPGWVPKLCLKCRSAKDQASETSVRAASKKAKAAAPRKQHSAAARGQSSEENLTIAEVLAKYSAGPSDGVFTDGAAHPNPGPGGWGAVYVVGGEIKGESWGDDPDTTNNRMELIALIEGCKLVPKDTSATLWTDSQLCVKTINEWAKGWEARGWKRTSGGVKNLDLVQELYRVVKGRPELELRWIKAHSGNRWNEYADSLATAYRRTVR